MVTKKSKTLNVRVTPGVYDAVKKSAVSARRTVSDWCSQELEKCSGYGARIYRNDEKKAR